MSTEHRYLSLDGLRGVAAFAVVVSHASISLLDRGGYESVALAVDFFFMLSGFVLAHAYGDRLNSGYAFSAYLIRRVVRLYPLILLGTILSTAAYLLRGDDVILLTRLTLQGILLVPDPLASANNPSIFPLNPPAWSLFYEMVASILLGLGLWLRGKFLPALVTILAGAGLAYVILRVRSLDTGWSFATMHIGFLRVLFAFGVGTLIYRLRNHLPKWSLPGSALVLLLCAALFYLDTSAWTLIIKVGLIFPLILLCGANLRAESISLNHWSGALSYPLYILHWPVFLWCKGALMMTGIRPPPIILGALGVAAAVVTAYLALRLYDEPVRARLGRLLAGRRK